VQLIRKLKKAYQLSDAFHNRSFRIVLNGTGDADPIANEID
jgi:hypothetical protein